MRRIAVAVLALTGFAAAAALAQGPAATEVAIQADPALYTGPQRLVPLKHGRRLNLICIGSGSPTVILEAGAQTSAVAWRRVQGQIGAFTRACAYDRAGFGYSDPSTRPSTASNIVDDLHQLLATAGVKRPIVLVGHSMGGLYATLYADLHPREVAGMVLVDSSFPGQNRQFASVLAREEIDQRSALIEQTRRTVGECAALARGGRLADPSKCQPIPATLPQVLQEALKIVYGRPAYYEAALSEWEAYNGPTFDSLSPNDRTEIASARSFGMMPLVVLTAINGEPKQAAIWKAGHDLLAARSTTGKNVVVPNTGHNIQAEQPAVVVQAVQEVVEAARAPESKRAH